MSNAMLSPSPGAVPWWGALLVGYGFGVFRVSLCALGSLSHFGNWLIDDGVSDGVTKPRYPDCVYFVL